MQVMCVKVRLRGYPYNLIGRLYCIISAKRYHKRLWGFSGRGWVSFFCPCTIYEFGHSFNCGSVHKNEDKFFGRWRWGWGESRLQSIKTSDELFFIMMRVWPIQHGSLSFCTSTIDCSRSNHKNSSQIKKKLMNKKRTGHRWPTCEKNSSEQLIQYLGLGHVGALRASCCPKKFAAECDKRKNHLLKLHSVVCQLLFSAQRHWSFTNVTEINFMDRLLSVLFILT